MKKDNHPKEDAKKEWRGPKVTDVSIGSSTRGKVRTFGFEVGAYAPS